MSRTLTNIGLKGGYAVGVDDWGPEMDDNLLKLSLLVQAGVISRIAAVPGSPAEGDAYVLTAAPHDTNIAVYDDGAWVYFAPAEGWWVYDRDTNNYISFDGAAWGDFAGGSGIPEAPVDGTQYVRKDAGWVHPTGGGGGSGAWSIVFKPRDNEPPAANYAAYDTRNNHPVLSFDAATQETAVFSGVLPNDYGGNGITVDLYVVVDTAVTGTIGFDVAFERIDAGTLDIDADSFGAATTVVAVNVPGTSGVTLKMSVDATDGTNMDGLAAGDMFRLRVRRDVANDTTTGDGQLLAVCLREVP